MVTSPAVDEPTVLADRYELLSRLGSGGAADVYRARDTLLGRDVAIKVFRSAVAEKRFDDRQRAEINLLARLNHPGLVTIFDAGSGLFAGGSHRAFLVMELVPGPSLADRLARGVLPPAQAAIVGAQVAESLAYIHEAGVVHRDVKPANILLPGDERTGATEPWTKLTDFGIARLIEDAHLTSTGLLLGTPGYLSPEQAIGVSPGPPTDVYALGLVVLECRTGVRAFPGTALESATARLHRDPDVPARLGSAWAALLRSMTARDAGDRVTALEASVALRELVADPGPTRALPVVTASALPPDDDATQADGPRVQATKVQAAQVQATQVLAAHIDATQVQATQVLAAHVDATRVQATQVLAAHVDATQVQAARVLAAHVDATQVLATHRSDPPLDRAPAPSDARLVEEDVSDAARRGPRAGSDTSISSRPARRRALGRMGFAALGLSAVVGGGLWLWAADQAAPAPAPSYPAVPGELGRHLQGLEGSVKP